MDWGVVLGLGAAVDVGRATFRVDLRHDRGLRNLYGGGDELTVVNRSVVVTAGFVARLGR